MTEQWAAPGSKVEKVLDDLRNTTDTVKIIAERHKIKINTVRRLAKQMGRPSLHEGSMEILQKMKAGVTCEELSPMTGIPVIKLRARRMYYAKQGWL